MSEPCAPAFRPRRNRLNARFGCHVLSGTIGTLSLLLLVQVAAGAGYSTAQTIASVTQKTSGLVSVAPKNGNWGNPDGCSKSDRFLIPANAKARKELLALVLSGHLQGRRIRARLSGCARSGGAGLTFPTAVSITLF